MCMDTEPKFPDKKVTVMAVGSGAMNIINRLSDKIPEDKNINLLCVSTDKQVLKLSKVKTLQIGKKTANGLGCGGNVEKGKRAAEESREQIINKIKNANLLILIVCLSGGTGTGAGVYISEIAKEMQIKTSAIVTMPFSFEGIRRNKIALDGLDGLKEYTDVYTYKNDDILEKVVRTMTMKEAFSTVDSLMAENILSVMKEN